MGVFYFVVIWHYVALTLAAARQVDESRQRSVVENVLATK